MSHLRQLKDASLDKDSLLTVGAFDGFHLGHRTLVRRLVARARATGRLALALTFFPHPDKVLQRAPQRHYLTTPERRAALLLEEGVDHVITLPFDASTRQQRAAAFVERLTRHLRMKELWVGADFALGFQREGDIDFLRAQGEARGFQVKAIDLIANQARQGLIHSAEIRDCLRGGEIAAANAMLGRAYALSGRVIRGEQRGRRIGAPTANLEVWDEQIVPGNGVYAAWARLGNATFAAATNIGTRPTFAGDSLSIEAHLLDFERDIYGEELELRFERRLRPERKFDGLDQLVEQIQADIEATRALLRQD